MRTTQALALVLLLAGVLPPLPSAAADATPCAAAPLDERAACEAGDALGVERRRDAWLGWAREQVQRLLPA